MDDVISTDTQIIFLVPGSKPSLRRYKCLAFLRNGFHPRIYVWLILRHGVQRRVSYFIHEAVNLKPYINIGVKKPAISFCVKNKLWGHDYYGRVCKLTETRPKEYVSGGKQSHLAKHSQLYRKVDNSTKSFLHFLCFPFPSSLICIYIWVYLYYYVIKLDYFVQMIDWCTKVIKFM